jgi:hypothetical protein
MSDAAVSLKEEHTSKSVSVSEVSLDGEARVTVSTVTVTNHWGRTLHHKNLARSISAIASLAGALSVLIGVIAAHMAPHGWKHVTMALHLTRKPLLLQLAPYIAGFAVAAATAAGLLGFYSWYRDGKEARLSGGAGSSPR